MVVVQPDKRSQRKADGGAASPFNLEVHLHIQSPGVPRRSRERVSNLGRDAVQGPVRTGLEAGAYSCRGGWG